MVLCAHQAQQHGDGVVRDEGAVRHGLVLPQPGLRHRKRVASRGAASGLDSAALSPAAPLARSMPAGTITLLTNQMHAPQLLRQVQHASGRGAHCLRQEAAPQLTTHFQAPKHCVAAHLGALGARRMWQLILYYNR